jgi:hypothetical protein
MLEIGKINKQASVASEEQLESFVALRANLNCDDNAR